MYSICYYGNPVLRIKASEIPKEAIASFKTVAENMFETMYAYQGIGLAAQQVGLTDSILVVDIHEPEWERVAMINPKITGTGTEEMCMEEGCLSFPDIRADIVRPEKIEVRYYDLNGDCHEKKLDGLIARVLLHEIDHLNGVLFIDRMSPAKRFLIKNKLNKLRASHKDAGSQ